MSASPPPRLIAEAWEALFRAQVAILRDISAEFPEGDLTMVEYDLLFNLSRLPDHAARPRDLNHLLLLSQPSVSRLIERLAARGLVTKEPDPNDRRGVVVALTEAGLQTFRRVGVTHVQSIARRFGDALDVGDLQTLIELCDRARLGR